MKQNLFALVQDLKNALREKLTSVILYGSATTDDWQEQTSDLNILCVLQQISAAELSACEPVFRNWQQNGNPTPLLLTAEEVQTSTDCFPMEFCDIQEHRTVLHGTDIVAELTIDRSFYRAQVEHELRVKHIRLRQKAATMLSTPDKLLKLLTDSISTFCVLGRHALVLSGSKAQFRKKEVLSDLERAMSRSLKASHEILAIRSKTEPSPVTNTKVLFEGYLEEMGSLVRFVDMLDK